jgi:GT2 family glycosyltransferase
MSKRVQIFILSRDRVDYLRKSLQSVMDSAQHVAEVIVSDNSTNEDVRKMMELEFPSIQVIAHNPPLPALMHFNHLIDIATAEFFMLFHDDDILLPMAIEESLRALDANQIAVACAHNSQILNVNRPMVKTLMGNFLSPREIKNPVNLLSYYMEIGPIGPAAFPSYVYRSKLVQKTRLNFEEAGKYSDVTFLVKLLQNGSLLWLPQVLMQTRIHADNDSRIENVGARMRLLRYACSHHRIPRKGSLATSYRYRIWLRWWLQHLPFLLKRPSTQRLASIKFLLYAAPKMMMNKNFWLRVLRRFMN